MHNFRLVTVPFYARTEARASRYVFFERLYGMYNMVLVGRCILRQKVYFGFYVHICECMSNDVMCLIGVSIVLFYIVLVFCHIDTSYAYCISVSLEVSVLARLGNLRCLSLHIIV